MADNSDISKAEQAYADAAAKITPAKRAAVKAKPAPKPGKKAEPAKPVVAKKAETKPAPVAAKSGRKAIVKKKPAMKKALPVKKVPEIKPISEPVKTLDSEPATQTAVEPIPFISAKRTAPAAPMAPITTAAKIAPALEPTITELKERIMATAKKSPDLSTIVTEIKDKAKAAYEKGTSLASEVGEFTKGNLDAMVESSKIIASGAQEIGRDYVEESKSAFETITADMKKIAAVKSPTEFFQLQGELARRNFDSVIAFGSKSSEKFVKLSNEALAPISNRVSVAVEKISKAA